MMLIIDRMSLVVRFYPIFQSDPVACRDVRLDISNSQAEQRRSLLNDEDQAKQANASELRGQHPLLSSRSVDQVRIKLPPRAPSCSSRGPVLGRAEEV